MWGFAAGDWVYGSYEMPLMRWILYWSYCYSCTLSNVGIEPKYVNPLASTVSTWILSVQYRGNIEEFSGETQEFGLSFVLFSKRKPKLST